MYQEQRLAEILELLAEKKAAISQGYGRAFFRFLVHPTRVFFDFGERSLCNTLEDTSQIPSFNDRLKQLSQEKGYNSKKPMTFSNRGRLADVSASFSIWHSIRLMVIYILWIMQSCW